MKRVLAIALITMMLLASCATDPYDGEGIVTQSAMNKIKGSRDCASLQATFDRNWELTRTASAGSLTHKRGGKFMTAANARMEEIGCYN